MDGANGDEHTQTGLFRDEDLERALKLSLNPEEQASKEQKEYVLACKESLVGANSNFPIDMELQDNAASLSVSPIENNRFIFNPNLNFMNSQEITGPKYNMSPTNNNPNDISSKYKDKDKNEYINKDGTNITNVTVMQKKIYSEESFGDIMCVKTNDSDNFTKAESDVRPIVKNLKSSVVNKLDENSLENKNRSFTVKSSPVKDINKKKRKAAGGEANVKQGSTNKPIPLAQAAAGVKEAPVCKFNK